MRIYDQRKFHIESGLFFAIVFGVIFSLSCLTPLVADDFNYTFGYASDRRISSLMDIWTSMKWHRLLLNGRVFSHGWLSLVLMYPRWVYAALNAMVGTLFSFSCIGFFRDWEFEHPLWAAACVWILLWICMPGFGQVFFWTAGACNYFWGISFAWFIIWRVLHLEKRQDRSGIKRAFLLLPAFVAGAWSEHISFAMLMVLFLILVWCWIQSKHFPFQQAVILASGCAGYLFLMLAPASKLVQRFHDAGDPTENGNLSKLMEIIPENVAPFLLVSLLLIIVLLLCLWRKQGARTVGLTVSGAAAAICFCGMLLFAIKGWKENQIFGIISSSLGGFLTAAFFFFWEIYFAIRNNTARIQIFFAMTLAFSGICSLALFLFGEYFPLRGFCAPVSLLILGGVLLSQAGHQENKRMLWTSILICSWFVICFALGAKDIVEVHHQALAREAGFMEAAAGDKRVVTRAYEYRTKYTAQYGNPDLYPDAGWPNGVMADYYDVIRIVVEP